MYFVYKACDDLYCKAMKHFFPNSVQIFILHVNPHESLTFIYVTLDYLRLRLRNNFDILDISENIIVNN